MDITGSSGMHTNSATLFAAMVEAAKAAGAGLMQDRARQHTLDIRRKSGADFFSEADLNAESTVRRVLSEAAPEFGFLGEEGGLIAGKDPESTWIVDPLDGTTNFLRSMPTFAVNIALEQRGEIVAAVTFVPAMDELFHAVADATEESILNALCAAETTTGHLGRTAHALPLDRLEELMVARG